MSKHVDRPIIFPLSNPTRLCEVAPRGSFELSLVAFALLLTTCYFVPSSSDANEWSKGKALLATGSPFDPVKNPEGGPDYVIAECNVSLSSLPPSLVGLADALGAASERPSVPRIVLGR